MIGKTAHNIFIVIAWIITLLISLLPDILLRELTGSLPAWLFWAKVGLIAIFLLVCLVWKYLRPLWLFAAVLLPVYLLEWGVGRLYQILGYTSWLAGSRPFVQNVGAVEIPLLTRGILMVLVMLMLTGSLKRFFLVKGKLDAQASPIRWILTRPPSWRILGPAIAAAMCLGLVAFSLIFGMPPSAQSLQGSVTLLPFILLFALANSFSEEMIYRAPWLSALEGPVGSMHALLITAVYFGIGHFYGVPYGIVGVIMAFIPGWLMGKSMLETRGFTWAWFIHFCMDVVVFFFVALGSVTPGG